MSDPVECHSGYEYAERPVALHWEGERLTVDEVEAGWRIPGGKRFRVRPADGRRLGPVYGGLHDERRIHPPS